MVEEAVKIKLNKHDIKESILILEDLLKYPISDMFGCEIDFLRIRSRQRELVDARSLFFYCTCKLLGYRSQISVGREFGYDHSTVSHAEYKIKDLLGTYSNVWQPRVDYIDIIIKENIEIIK